MLKQLLPHHPHDSGRNSSKTKQNGQVVMPIGTAAIAGLMCDRCPQTA